MLITGPMIHIGAMVGAAVGQVKSKSLNWYPKVFWRYHNDRDRRDFISSGAAAGMLHKTHHHRHHYHAHPTHTHNLTL